MADRDIDLVVKINSASNLLDTSDSLLLIVESATLHDSMVHVTKNMLNRDLYGIYLSLNKPHKAIFALLSNASIDTKRLFFIDCVSSLVHETLTRHDENVIYASGLHDLAEDGGIPSAVAKFVHSVPGEKFLIVDALRTLFIFNEPGAVSRFIHSLLAFTKEHDVKIVVLTRKEDDSFIKLVSNAFDEIVEL